MFDHRLKSGRSWGSSGSKQCSGSVEQMTVGRAEQAVIAYFDESVWEHMLKKTTDKLFGTHRRACDLRSGRIFVRASDVAILQREDAVIADGHPQDGRSKRAEGVLAIADGLRVHDPVFGPYVLVDAREERSW